MNVQEIKAVSPDKADDYKYQCDKCFGMFHYHHCEQEAAVKGLKPTGNNIYIIPKPENEGDINKIELPILAQFFLFFINFIDKDISLPATDGNKQSYGSIYDKTCNIYYKIPYGGR